ncbi:hypothetical protein FKP32DRAFT_1531994, partial [Trametes sanguinea]
MVYIGVAPGGHGFRFMRSPNNVIFTSAHALFDETMFPKCPANKRRRTSRLDDEPEDDPSDHESSIPSGFDDDDDDDEPRRPPQHLPPKGQEQEHDDAPETPPQARTPSPPPLPGNSSAPSPPSDIPAPSASGDASGSANNEGSGHSSDEVEDALRAGSETGLAQLCQEGGVALINYLLMKAVPPVDDDLPDTSNVREWTYRDITRLPPAEQ